MRTTLAKGAVDFLDNGDDQLLIIFAHRDAPGFAFETVTQSLQCDKLLIRDPSLRGWYNAGLPGVGETLTDIAAFIRANVPTGRYRRTSTLGSSMGGYAAVLFGALLGVDRVLAFNPQTVLDRLFPLSPSETVVLQCPDLGPVVASVARGTRFDLVIGEDDAVDLCHAANLTGSPDVSTWTVPGSSHLLTEELNRRGELAPLLRQWFEVGRMEVLRPVPAAASRSKAERLKRGVTAYLAGQHGEALPLLAEASKDHVDHPGLSLFVGMAAASQNDTETAIAALRATLRHRPGWHHAEDQLRRCLESRTDTFPAAPKDETVSDQEPAEFEGVGDSIDAAVLDAIASAARGSQPLNAIRADVISWGVDISGIGGARLFWARIRTGAFCSKPLS